MSTGKGNLDNLHWAVNDFYTKFDEGKINKENATKLLVKSCEEFIQGSERVEELPINSFSRHHLSFPTFKVKQTVKIEHTWIVQAKDIEMAKDIAMTSDPDDSNELETLAISVEVA